MTHDEIVSIVENILNEQNRLRERAFETGFIAGFERALAELDEMKRKNISPGMITLDMRERLEFYRRVVSK